MMKPPLRVSRSGLDLIKRFEGYRRRSARLPGGGWTIGYGHTRSAREGAEVSEAEAEALLVYDMMKVCEALGAWCFTPLNQNQVDALAAFAFNIGLDAFRTSNVLRLVNQGDLLEAADAIESWRLAEFEGGRLVFDSLVRRRAAEKALFLTPPDGFQPAPSPVLQGLFDPAAAGRPPVRPVLSSAPLAGERAELTVEWSEPSPPPEPETGQEAEPPPPGAEAEPPSPTEVAAANLAARLERLLAEGPPPFPDATQEPEEGEETLPEIAPPPEAEDELPETSAAADPFAGDEPPRSEEEVFSGPFGRRAEASEARRPKIDPLVARVSALGLVGFAMVLGSLAAMLYGRSSLFGLVVGLLGVVFLIPAASRFIAARLEKREANRRPKRRV